MTRFEPRVVNTGDPGVTVWDFAGGANHVRRLLGADQTAGRFSFFESILAPGFVVTQHVHRDEDEYWYMLDPGIEVLLGDEVIRVLGSSVVAIPAGAVHEVRNTSSASVRSIFFAMPGGLERFFAGMHELIRSGAGRDEFDRLFEDTGTSFPRSSRK